MTVTRSQTGSTPRKPRNPDFVETPGRTRRSGASRRSETPATEDVASSNGGLQIPEEVTKMNGNGKANGNDSNVERRGPGRPRKLVKHDEVEEIEEEDVVADFIDPKVDADPVYEFGGAPGVTAMMIGFPLLMWYMWLGATYYDGAFPYRSPGQSWSSFGQQMFDQVYEGAFPHARAWTIYWTFFVMQGIFYLYMPGVYSAGKPLPHLKGKKLQYYCSGMWSFYSTIALSLALHYFDIFKLYTLIDEFGPLMSVAIFTGFIVSVVAYVSAIVRGAEHRMTGSLIYDFFMGAELNPRMFKWLDFKMFFEVRLPWFILFFVSLGTAARQYETYGYVSGEVSFVLMAHFLYANACCKGEEMITTTWDMYYEKWGFMLIFWNLAGVPLSYCHCTIYLANHHPDTYKWPVWALVPLYISYLFAYWVWDTCGSQKNKFRAREKGTAQDRNTFPQLPWREIKNPRYITTDTGDNLLCDGWYRYARKIHYTCDVYFAFTWGLITGFKSPFPWFYPIFFILMIIHRAARDIQRCKVKYGKYWVEYEKTVPYIFIPYVY